VTLPQPSTDVATRRRRALVDDTRRGLLDQLRPAPLDVRTLAGRTGLHANAVRQHLHVLHDAGLVVEHRERVAGRVGRPRVLYRSVDGELSDNPFELMARLLVDVAAGRAPGDAGAAEGAVLAANHPSGDAATVVSDLAAGRGFAVHVDGRPDGTRVVLDRCPFASIAGPLVCAVHQGFVDGAARAAGSTVIAFDLADPAVRPCELTLAPSPERSP
jgi:predicted ArsR family transcriptional regulator